MRSLLSRASAGEVRPSPFPHLVIHSPVDEELCRELIARYPAGEVISGGKPPGNNQRFSYPAWRALSDDRVASVWRDFVTLHLCDQFLQEVLVLFQDHLRALYPTLLEERGQVGAWRAGVRHLNSFREADVLLDAQICLNTPVRDGPSSVRGPHLDLPTKLFAGLFYLRRSDDDSRGGDLDLFRFKDGPAGFTGMAVARRHLVAARRVRYRNNVLVLFLNSLASIHGVTPRSPTAAPRLLVNLLGEVSRPLFDVAGHQEGRPVGRSALEP